MENDIIELSEKGITVRVILDSLIKSGIRITTFELEYPRFVHAELMTHRVFSRNAASSRAIPVKKLLSRTLKEMVMPVHWGANQPGMQADGQLSGIRLWLAKKVWRMTGRAEVVGAWLLNKIGLHKQISNRPMEAHHNIKIVMTSTEWDNWYNLRNHKDAQPEIALLAKLMAKAHGLSFNPEAQLYPGHWHIPYVVSTVEAINNKQQFWLDGETISLEQALKISSSCCAQISYRLLDTGLDKAISLYDRLINSEPRHSSPFEHCAKVPLQHKTTVFNPSSWEKGITHMNKQGCFWSNNFKGMIQYRAVLEQTFKENSCVNYLFVV